MARPQAEAAAHVAIHAVVTGDVAAASRRSASRTSDLPSPARIKASLPWIGVSFDVPTGKITTVVGPSGCGKTTLLRLASGLLAASDGTVFYNGRAGDRLEHRTLDTSRRTAICSRGSRRTATSSFRLAIRGIAGARTPGKSPALAASRRARWLRKPLSVATVGWNAEARLHRANAHLRADRRAS